MEMTTQKMKSILMTNSVEVLTIIDTVLLMTKNTVRGWPAGLMNIMRHESQKIWTVEGEGDGEKEWR